MITNRNNLGGLEVSWLEASNAYVGAHTNSFVIAVLAAVLCGCAGPSNGGGTTTGNPINEDSSASGAAAGAVGGALSGSESSGTLAQNSIQTGPLFWRTLQSSLIPTARASSNQVACPGFHTTAASCSIDGSAMMLDYENCSFSGSAAVWLGTLAVTPSSGTPTCGSFPNPGVNGTLYRQYVSSPASNAASHGQVTTKFGTVAVINDAEANLANFDGDSIAQITNSAYGTSIAFDSTGARSAVTIGHHLSVENGYDHSVTGSLAVTETAGDSAREVNGTLTVYHNQLRVIGSSNFSHVIHEDTCCLPVSGTITTTFSAGSVSPTLLGRKAVGKSESLTFTGCGVGTLQSYDGTSSTVTLSKCY